MKRLVTFALAVCIILCGIIPVSASENTVYISPGDSIQDAIASLGSDGTIILREGTYKINEPINLGSKNKNITIKGEGNVTVTGEDAIPFSSFEPCSDTAFLDALTDQSARNKIISVNLKDLGITDLGAISSPNYTNTKDTSDTRSGYQSTLTYNDKLLSIARYPNNDYVYIASVENLNSSGDPTYYKTFYKLNYTLKNDTRYKNWNSWGKDEYDRNGIWATAYYYINWSDNTLPVGLNSDGSLYGFTTQGYPGKTGQRLFFFNVPEELDAPGEWYLDRETGILYLYPEEGMKDGDVLNFTAYDDMLFEIIKSSNITFENIRFAGTNYRGFDILQCDGIQFDNCEFTGIGERSVRFFNCYSSGVKNSYFHDLGSYGVFFDSCGDRENLISSECFAYNTHFERFSNFRRTYSPAIQVYFCVGVVVSHCKFNDAPHFAIRYEGNDLVFEYNEFTELCTDTADAGAIYTGRRWDTRGNIIRYNYFHNLKQKATGDGVRAVYLDDCSSSTVIHGNLFYDVGQVALLAGGRYNEFTNNLMVNCERSVTAQSRGTKWAENTATGEYVSFYDTLRNSLYLNKTTREKTYFELDAWKEAYPEQCQTLLEDLPENRLDNSGYEKIKLPKYNRIKNNITFTTAGFSIDDNVKIYGTEVEYSYNTYDPTIFEKRTTSVISLDKDGDAYKNMPDFEDIPFGKMGLIKEGSNLPGQIHVIRNIYTEDFVFESEVGTDEEIATYDFPKNNATTTSGGTIVAGDYVKNNYEKCTETFDWKKSEGLLGFKRVSGLGDIEPTNRPGRQSFAVKREIPLYKGSNYSFSYEIANPEDLTDDKLLKPNPENGKNDSFSTYITLTAPSADVSPFSASNGAKTTSKSYSVALTPDRTTINTEFLRNADGFGIMSNGTKPFETGSVSSFSLRIYYGDVITYFDKFNVFETTTYSEIDVENAPGGVAELSGYFLSDTNNDRTKLTDKVLENGRIALEAGLTANLKLIPDEGRRATVTYNGQALPVVDNAVSFIPKEAGTLSINYINENPAITSVAAGTPVHSSNFKTIIDGITHTSENAIILYGRADIVTGKAYKSSGYYVTFPGENEAHKIPSISGLVGEVFTIKLFGDGITKGTYILKPYLITDDDTEYIGAEKTLTIICP